MKEDSLWYLPWVVRPELLPRGPPSAPGPAPAGAFAAFSAPPPPSASGPLSVSARRRRSPHGHGAKLVPGRPTLEPAFSCTDLYHHFRQRQFDSGPVSADTRGLHGTIRPSSRKAGGSAADDTYPLQRVAQSASKFRELQRKGLSSLSRRRVSSQGGPASPGPALSPTAGPVFPGHASAGSLPSLLKFSPEEHAHERPSYRRQSSTDSSRRSTKLRRQEAFKNERSAIAGRSRSLTHIDALEGAGSAAGSMLVKAQEADMDSRSEPDTTHDRLIVPAAEPPHVRRQKLARSQVSSSEYFSVSLEYGDEPREEFVPAEKGVSLQEALSGLCARHGIDLGNAHVYLDAGKNPCQSLSTDTSWMGGRHVRVRAKDDKSPVRGLNKSNNQFPSRKSAGSYRAKSGRFFSASTEDPGYACESGHEGSFKGTKTSKQRWSGLFGNSKDTKMETLVELLNNYTKAGLPRRQHSEPATDTPDEAATVQPASFAGCMNSIANSSPCGGGGGGGGGGAALEDDWRDLVEAAAQLPERQLHQQTAVWELVHTELAYIRTLKVVTDLFLACLESLQSSNILSEIDTPRLFSNITSIYGANRRFWREAFFPMLQAARASRQPLDPSLMLAGFLKFDEVFRPYQKYCSEQLQCQQYCREKHHENELFTAYLAWCETQKDCNRLRLMDILVKPMQRLTKYSLLLKAVLKNTQLEEQRSSLERMVRCVDEFVHNVNTTMRQREDNARLRGIIARIESYDVVDSKDDELEKLLRSYSELDLTMPMPGCHISHKRNLLFESDLKFRDNTTSKMDVHCFLLTDMLLVCKPATKRGGGDARVRVVRQPYLVERLRVHELGRDPPGLGVVYVNEYRTATAAFTLTCGDAQLVRGWAENIRKAQDLYAAAKQASAVSTSTSAPATQVVTRQASVLWGAEEDGEEAEDGECHSCASLGMAVAGRSPRAGSSRGSRVSSLAHSHSGSMDMNEVSSVSSVSHSRGVSVENELRGSSLSSDEGIPGLPSLVPGTDPACGLGSGPGTGTCSGTGPTGTGANKAPPLAAPAASPRSDRRSMLCKSPTPNTLSVQVPVYSSLGQSLPNLSLATSPGGATGHAGPPNPPSSLLLVPPAASGKGGHQHQTQLHHGGLLSPGHRGVSYPPPSPPRGSLRRGHALPQSRNPPLIKTRHVNSSCSGALPSACAPPPPPPPPLLSPTQATATAPAAAAPTAAVAVASALTSAAVSATSFDFDVPVIAGVSPPSEECCTPEPPAELGPRIHRHPPPKRAPRTDNRRYHTAGAIDDLKKQNSRDTSIHKRLSWNCGQGQGQCQGHNHSQGQGHGHCHITGQAPPETSGKCTSSESVHSSSGVSSTGSVQFGSIASELEEVGALEFEASSLQVVCENSGACCYDVSSPHKTFTLPSPSVEAVNMELLKSPLSPAPADPGGIMPASITARSLTQGAESKSTDQFMSQGGNSTPSKGEMLRLKNMMLADSSMEASNV